MPAYIPSLYTLWHRKRGDVGDDFKPNERAEWGLRQEDAVALYAIETLSPPEARYKYRRAGWCRHPRVDGMAASPDFFVLGRDGQPISILETKTADWLVHKRTWGDQPPLHILLQVQAQMACTGLDRAYCAVLIGGNRGEIYPIERRQRLIDEIEARVSAFWESIREGKEPPVDGTDSSARTVASMYPIDDGEEEPADLTADDELPNLCAELLHAAVDRQSAEKREQAARTAILAKLGDCRAAWCDGFLVSAPTVAAVPDKIITPEMVGEVIKGRAGFRRLKVKERNE